MVLFHYDIWKPTLPRYQKLNVRNKKSFQLIIFIGKPKNETQTGIDKKIHVNKKVTDLA